MTSPESTYWDRIVRSMSYGVIGGGRRGPLRVCSPRAGDVVAGLELRREADLHLREWLLHARVLGEQNRRRPLLPVRTVTTREADGAVPALELVRQERLGDVLALVALRRVHGVREEHHLGVAVERAVDRVFLELLDVAL